MPDAAAPFGFSPDGAFLFEKMEMQREGRFHALWGKEEPAFRRERRPFSRKQVRHLLLPALAACCGNNLDPVGCGAKILP